MRGCIESEEGDVRGCIESEEGDVRGCIESEGRRRERVYRE